MYRDDLTLLLFLDNGELPYKIRKWYVGVKE